MKLGVAQWRHLHRWDAKHGLAADWRRPASDLVPFGDVARRRRENNVGGLRYGSVHFNGSMSLRPAHVTIKSRTFVAHPRDVVLSKIDVIKGAVGVVPIEFGLVAFTAEYPIYDVESVGRALPEFLALACRTDVFRAKLDAAAVGHSGRRRVAPDVIEAMPIPMPSLPEQRQLVRFAQHGAERSAALRTRALRPTMEVLARISDELGLPQTVPTNAELYFVARRSALHRWSPEAARESSAEMPLSPRFACVPLGRIAEVAYGVTVDPSTRPLEHARPYLRVANVQAGYLDLSEVKLISVPDAIAEKAALRSGDVLLCEGNSPHLVGRPAIWKDEIPGCLHQNHVLRVRGDASVVEPEYLVAYMNTDFARSFFRRRAKQTTNLATINSTDVKDLPVVLPPLKVQRRIAASYGAAQRKSQRDSLEADDFALQVSAAVNAAIESGAPLLKSARPSGSTSK
jgi:type I restriction enzyme S subunit